MRLTEVAILRGGPSTEYDVSLKTGSGVLSVLNDEPFRTRDVVIDQTGTWYVKGVAVTPEQALTGVDVVFNALHGAYGEDGTVQRILDRLGIPYTGSRAYPSSIAMNKQLTKEIATKAGLLVPRGMRVNRDTPAGLRQAAQTISNLFGPHYVVKPNTGGSSLHTYVATSLAELVRALEQAFEATAAVLVEERVIGQEATVAVLEQYRQQRAYAFPPIEIVPPAQSFFDYEAKYNGVTEERCPGCFRIEESDELLKAAVTIHQALDLRHYSRSDFIVTPHGVYFLEANTLPGLTTASLFPKAIEAVGGTYRELVLHLLNLAHRGALS